MSERTAEVVRAEREKIAAQVEGLRTKMRALSAELLAVEGPIPDRSHRSTSANLTIKKADK